jgi:hypothetical protein
VAAAQGLLVALAGGRDEEVWEIAQSLAKGVVDDKKSVLAKAVLAGGPFAMRNAEELAELVLDEESYAEGGATKVAEPRKPVAGSVVVMGERLAVG